MFDVAIIGGGPAGLSCALVLGRCRRRVLVCDSGTARNLRSPKVNGYLGLPSSSPLALRTTGREQLRCYPSIQMAEQRVGGIEGCDGNFVLQLEDGETRLARKVVLATGLKDELPTWRGAEEFYGMGLYTCPYCDAWEHQDGLLAVSGRGMSAYHFAVHLTVWSSSVAMYSDGPCELPELARGELKDAGIGLREEPIVDLIGVERLEAVEFADGARLQCGALFLSGEQAQRSDLAVQLGCTLDEKGIIQSTRTACTTTPGVFVAGDVDTYVGTQLAIAAAADGARAAEAVHMELLRQDRHKAFNVKSSLATKDSTTNC